MMSIAVSVAKIEIQTQDTNNRVKAIEHLVFEGNGTPSLIARVSSLEAIRIATIAGTPALVARVVTLEADKNTTRWIIGVAIGIATVFLSALTIGLKFLDTPIGR